MQAVSEGTRWMLRLDQGQDLFTTLGDFAREKRLRAAAVVSGVFTGSAAWWVLLSTSVNVFRRAFSPGRMRLLNELAGTVIVIFGLVAILSLAF